MSSRTTRVQIGLLSIAALLAAALAIVVVRQPPARAQGPGPGGFGPPGPGGFMREERRLVARFDKNGDSRLDLGERKAAREAIAGEARFGPFGGGRRGGGGRGFVVGTPGRAVAPADVRSYPSAPLYDPTALRTIFLQFENPDWEQELAAFYNSDVEVPAVVTVDGRTYKDVGIHFRGASSFMMVPEGSKRSLNLSVDFVHRDQKIGGYRTLNLLNANGDPTFVRPMLYSEIARAYVPAPKMSYVRVAINGESWGIYLNAQQFNRDFLRDFFKSEKGARWKVPGSPGGRGGMEYLGDDPAAYKRTYEIKTADNDRSWKDLIHLFRVLNETPPDKLEAALAPILDVDGVLKFLAVEVALVNTDGYWTRASDYDIYQDEKGRFHVIPHDMNEGMMTEGGRGFGRRPGGPPPDGGRGFPPDGMRGFGPPRGGRGFGPPASVDLDPLVGLDDPSKPLRSKLLAVPALRTRYLGYVRDIAERWLDWKVLEPIAQRHQALIAADVKADTRKLYSYEAFEAGLIELRDWVERRRAFLLK